ncbi:MAG: hypothetical protein U5K72_07750 [Balneolaceae bacterium]|nr:hypothetical protein [Balneolaceae bacterium]
METTFSGKPLADEGYVYSTYGKLKYLKHAVSSVQTLRRYDQDRPVALFCSKEHKEILSNYSLSSLFTHIFHLPEEYQSITGFKHNVYRFLAFKKNLFLDSDILWCKNPDNLWKQLSAYKFTITGNQTSDLFFGAPKGFRVLIDVLFRRRKRTLRRFDITYLSRVQSGLIYADDYDVTEQVCELAKEMLSRQDETHFRSRKEEKGRSEESCEWSYAIAMAKLKLQVFPWLNGYESSQLDFIESYTNYDKDFKNVKCLFFGDRFIYDLKGLKKLWIQKLLIRMLTSIPGKGDYLYVTPYCLHFGWYHQKEPLNEFSERCWQKLINSQ